MAQFTKPTRHIKGQMLVELLIAFAIASITLPAILVGFTSSREGRVNAEQRTLAVGLMKEAEEAVRSVRERDWNEISVSGTYHPEISGTSWAIVSGEEEVNGFTRSIVIGDFLRDGAVDPSTKQIEIVVSWGSILPSSVRTTILLTRYLGNAVNIQTTKAEFDQGTKNNVNVTNIAGGEIQLGAGGNADWCEPALTIEATDLPKSGVANAISAIPGRVFAGTGDNASGVSFANVTVTDTDPPDADVVGTFDGYKTNAIFGEAGYAYLGTDNNSKEIEIVNLTSVPYAEAGYFNAPGNGNGSSVSVSGNTGYMTSGSNFYSFDLSSKAGSRNQLGSVVLAGSGTKIFVVGNYAYVSIGGSDTEMQIVDITNPSAMSVVGSANINGAGGRDIYVNQTGTRAYLATGVSASQRELFIIDVAVKTGVRPSVGSYESGGMGPKGITVVPGNRAILVGNGAEEYQVINISNEAVPIRCGGLNIDTGVNGLSSVIEADGDAYSYIITGDAGGELKIIEGGPGGEFGVSGTFESSIIDFGGEVAANRYVADFTTPNQTTLQMQFAGADASGGDCSGATYNFTGPDGTAGTKYNLPSAEIFRSNDGASYENPARCFKYKLFLDSMQPGSTPIFNSMTINYSP